MPNPVTANLGGRGRFPFAPRPSSQPDERQPARLNERSLTDDLRHSDPKALFDMVRHAKHLGFWKGYHDNQRRLRDVEDL